LRHQQKENLLFHVEKEFLTTILSGYVLIGFTCRCLPSQNQRILSSTMGIFAVAVIACWTAAAAAHSSGPPSSPFDNPFTYSQSFSVDLSDEWTDENDLVASSSDPAASADMCVSSSLLYEEGCLLSCLAIMGGDIPDISGMVMEARVDPEEAGENDEDDDDDDDDNNDGSSSMLSNTSVQRTKTTETSGGDATGHTVSMEILSGESCLPSLPGCARSVNAMLAIRGGAAAAAAASPRFDGKTHKATIKTLQKSATSSPRVGSQVLQRLFTTALVTLVFEGMIGHILEFLKITMQTTSDSSYMDVIREITASKGIIGLWDGFCPWGVIQAVSKGAVFGLTYAVALSLLRPLTEQGILSMPLACTLAGGIGGGMQGYVLSPMLLLKTRVMTNPIFRESMTILATTSQSFQIGIDVVTSEGLAALMKGANVFALKRVLDWASRYFFADLFERLLLKMKQGKPLTVAEKSFASLLGGVASTGFTLPLDVLVAKIQDAKKAGMHVNPLLLFQEELREVGWSGLQHNYMRGFEARLLHVSLTTLGTFLTVNYCMASKTTIH
jgi:hypothetical protein